MDHQSFRDLLAAPEPQYSVPCPKTIIDSLKKDHAALKNDLIMTISGKPCAITHDSWTSLNNESYETVTVSFISDAWQLECKVLETTKVNGSHTAEIIADTIRSFQERWSAVTDNASNGVKAFKLLGWRRMSCMGHNINLVVRKGLSINELNRLVGKGRSLVSFFHHSPQAMGVLLEKQKLLLDEAFQGHKLITDCPTRWNSTYEMMARLSEQMPALHAVATDKSGKYSDLRMKLYTFEEQQVIESIIMLLKPFKMATEMLSAEKKPTLSLVSPIGSKLEQALNVLDNDIPLIKKVKSVMLGNIEKRHNADSQQLYHMASSLDPCTKLLNFLTPVQRHAAWTSVQLACEEELRVPRVPVAVKVEPLDVEPKPPLPQLPQLPPHDPSSGYAPAADIRIDTAPDIKPAFPQRSNTDEPPAKKLKPDGWLDDIIFVSESPALSQKEIIEMEIDKYQSEPAIPQGDNSLIWWKAHELFYPHLAKLAKRVLAIPASSVPSERIFSLAGNIVNKKRSQLSNDNVDMLIFLKKNSK